MNAELVCNFCGKHLGWAHDAGLDKVEAWDGFAFEADLKDSDLWCDECHAKKFVVD